VVSTSDGLTVSVGATVVRAEVVGAEADGLKVVSSQIVGFKRQDKYS
jgi:hypothetical protein